MKAQNHPIQRPVRQVSPFRRLPAWGIAAALGLAVSLPRAEIVCCNAIDSSVEKGRSVELVFMAWDANGASPQVAFVKDLGLSMGDFFVQAQQDAGSRFNFWLGGTSDAVWADFLNAEPTAGTKVDPSKVRWAVFAFDTAGDMQPGTLNLYTTNRQGASGSAGTILGLSDTGGGKLADSTASVFSWLSYTNFKPAMAVPGSNASVVLTRPDGPAWPFRTGQPGNDSGELTFNGNFTRPIDNQMGQSSWFYAVTTADPDFAEIPVAIDEFDNLAHDGYWGLAQGTDPAHPGEFLLSYTLQAVTSAAEQAQRVVAGNSFARIAGFYSLNSPAGKAASTLSLTEGFLRGLARPGLLAAAAAGDPTQRTQGLPGVLVPTPAVPEPSAWVLSLAGLLLVGAAAARRRG